MSDIAEFCRLTGRTVSSRPEHSQLIDIAYNDYLNLTGLKDLAPATVITDDRQYRAFHLVGTWNGLVIDRRYLDTLEAFIFALLHGENCTDVARPVLGVIAAEMAGRHPTEALMLRHEPLSELYALENAPRAIESLIECHDLESIMAPLHDKSRSAWLGLAFVYVVLHEIGHWIYQVHRHDNAIARNVAEIRQSIDAVRQTPIDDRLRDAASRWPDMASVFDSDSTPQSLVEEVFCDRFAAGAMFARAATDGTGWDTAFVSLRLIQEAMRMLHRGVWIAEDFGGAQQFLAMAPTLENDAVARGFSAMHARAYISSCHFSSFVPRIYREYAGEAQLDAEHVGATAERLLTQSLLFFTQVAGPSMERCIYLMMRAVRSKRQDDEVFEFFDRLRQRHELSDDADIQAAFDAIVDAASRQVLGH